MKAELDAALVKDFPNLYRDRYGDVKETLMCFGFECGDGWEPLIRRLSAKLEALILAVPESKRALYRAVQVKEKYGSLRYYMTYETDEMSDLIRVAEDESAVTCETCGTAGKLRGQGWYYTACDEHTK